ncbi:hypothetical protein BKI52_22050 [marine bacterium AO1-C]|nr:hypothetical protein BKI52_22050 [marine bacterium AO1-C]
MKKFTSVLRIALFILFGLFLLMGAYRHIAEPAFYTAFVPPFIPENLANILAAVAEGVVGIALLIPKTRKLGALGFTLMMIVFLPIHIWDLFRAKPAIGSFNAAVIRVAIQLVVIYAGWWLWKNETNK